MTYLAKDFANQNDIRWCPGCGDYAILKHFQSALAKSGISPEQTVVVSGIGCSSRLPYYMNTYGFHTIHGRALPIASGLKLSRPELNVWVITGDGDALSIGGNHFIHFFRRNIDINVLLFNNHIYGLTKGQYSPTSSLGQYSKSSPRGTQESSLNALQLALNTGAGFLCRTFDRDAAYMQQYIIASQAHTGSALVEILQNCPIFNDGIFDNIIEKRVQSKKIIRLQNGELIRFGENEEWTIVLDKLSPKIVLIENSTEENRWIHDETSISKAQILCQLGFGEYSDFPVAMGILYRRSLSPDVSTSSYDHYLSKIDAIIQSGKIKEM